MMSIVWNYLAAWDNFKIYVPALAFYLLALYTLSAVRTRQSIGMPVIKQPAPHAVVLILTIVAGLIVLYQLFSIPAADAAGETAISWFMSLVSVCGVGIVLGAKVLDVIFPRGPCAV